MWCEPVQKIARLTCARAGGLCIARTRDNTGICVLDGQQLLPLPLRPRILGERHAWDWALSPRAITKARSGRDFYIPYNPRHPLYQDES